jgi:sec-independent protein translocase protein TatA
MNTPFLLFMDVGAGELLLILIAVFLLFGPKKIPELARKIGKGMYELNKAKQGIKDELEREVDSPDKENQSEQNKRTDEG